MTIRPSHRPPAGLLVAVCLAAGPGPAAPPEPVRFNRDVRPILADACVGCHGPGKQKAGLRLDDRAVATKPVESGAIAFVSGKPGASEAIRRLRSADPTEVMPPPDAHKALTPAQKDTLVRWVAEGATYEVHWSFAPLVRPPVPAVPATADPINAFVGARLATAGLAPNPEADRPTLIRRVAFALTGLPPTVAEVDAFLADRDPGAYERLVNRYLASPAFGEEMARHWLDLARYADTHGLHLDNERGTWPYRDWVVRAFNTNLPFDRFTVEQLAGDLLPNPTRDQLVATGFNRCNVTTGEGGSVDAEWHFRNAVDRAATAAETWLGLTAGCAQCHDHKFDPVSQKDFYALYAFFYSAAGPALDGNVLLHEPTVRLPTPEQEKRLADLDARLKELSPRLTTATATIAYVDPADAAAVAGAAAGKDAADPTRSFRAWVAARGGPNKDKLPKEVTAAFGATGPRTAAQLSTLRTYYLRRVHPPTVAILAPLVTEHDRLTAERVAVDGAVAASMIFRDAPTPRQAFVMARGQYDRPGEKVGPGTPAFLPPLRPAATRATRLDLARWLVASEQPLTARVYVNRLWQQFFGVGLVATSSDFGAQGEPPTHPELLDWLAADFRDSGWDVKRLVRRLVTSAAFRRAPRVTPDTLRIDPENRLYARGPRVRLDAEQVRDNALAVAGLLNPAVGGKGVKPYQPEKIWEPVAFTGSNTQFYKQDSGLALYRRSLYTFFKRTAPPPFLANFDAPNREQPCGRRTRSNTPLQALQLMNDVQHVEAARTLAERVLTEGGPTPADRVAFAFRLVLARKPSAAESAVVEAELAAHLARYTAAPADARKLIAAGESKPRAGLEPEELAAYTLVANMLLNLDETLTRN